ncbi:MAG: NAD-dependent epimerase/dehydratase family protein [Nitrososphaeria archaeon]|nr:NAD-dependent epimerase/dehydratase family protein [Nitrososphaeria archaeon]
MNSVVTGGAGFIGSHIVDRLQGLFEKIIVLDNLSSGSIENIRHHFGKEYFSLKTIDLKFFKDFDNIFEDIESVFHYAANPEVRVSVFDPRAHFEENVVSTFNVLEACRKYDISYFVFASTSTVYGDARTIPTPEEYYPLEPISVYGGCKLACENLIITYSKLYGIRSLILRYANVIGPRSSHGVIFDFINKLRKDSRVLEILGDGLQKKSYIHVEDAVDATIHLYKNLLSSKKDYEIYNVGNDDWITVKEIADIIVKEMCLHDVKYCFSPATVDGRGWLGDVKFMLLDISKLKSTGWFPKMGSEQAVKSVVKHYLNRI